MVVDLQVPCIPCPRLCEDVCPTVRVERRETLSPTSLFSLLLWEKKDLLPREEVLFAVERCIFCQRCTSACEYHFTPWEFFQKERMRLRQVLKDQPPFSEEELWGIPPFHRSLGKGHESWLLLGSLKGVDTLALKRVLKEDPKREWWLPRLGVPVYMYTAWALGFGEVWRYYLKTVAREIEMGGFRGVAWADPHEGFMVRAFLEEIRYRGERGYAPLLLGLVSDERIPCTKEKERFSCCGAAGGYPVVAERYARTLSTLFPTTEDPVPGICKEHLEKNGRKGFITDWEVIPDR